MEYLEPDYKNGKEPITNISVPNYVYEHILTESGKGRILPYIDKSIKYKLCKDLNIFEKKMAEYTFIDIFNNHKRI